MFAFFYVIAVGWQVEENGQLSSVSAPLRPYVRPLAIGYQNGSGKWLEGMDNNPGMLETCVALRLLFAHFFTVSENHYGSCSGEFVYKTMRLLNGDRLSVLRALDIIDEDIRSLSPCKQLKAGNRELC